MSTGPRKNVDRPGIDAGHDGVVAADPWEEESAQAFELEPVPQAQPFEQWAR